MKRSDPRWIAALAATMIACNHGKPAVERRSTQATSVQPVAAGRVVAPGIVEPWGGEVRLAAHGSGYLASIDVAEGQRVAIGETIARLDDDPQRRAVEVAEAELREAEALFDKLLRGATALEIRELQADADAAHAKASIAEAEATRAAALGASGSVAAADMGRTLAEKDALAAIAVGANARLDAARRGALAEERRVTMARRDAARARLAGAHVGVAQRRVVTSSAGTVLVSRYHPGEYYAPDRAPIVILGDLRRTQVRLEVDDLDARSIAAGVACELFDEHGQRLANGRVIRVAPSVGRRSLMSETPSDRLDLRVREVFVDLGEGPPLTPGQRVWGHLLPG